LAAERPLLGQLRSQPGKLKRYLLLERLLWEAVDTERYRVYRTAWRAFIKRSPEATAALRLRPFAAQHQALWELCQAKELEPDPLGRAGRQQLLDKAIGQVLDLIPGSREEIALVQPPLRSLLP
jgi:hypothetical protein